MPKKCCQKWSKKIRSDCKVAKFLQSLQTLHTLHLKRKECKLCKLCTQRTQTLHSLHLQLQSLQTLHSLHLQLQTLQTLYSLHFKPKLSKKRSQDVAPVHLYTCSLIPLCFCSAALVRESCLSWHLWGVGFADVARFLSRLGSVPPVGRSDFASFNVVHFRIWSFNLTFAFRSFATVSAWYF